MKSKIKRRVCGGIAVAAGIYFIGSCGVLDLGQISLGRGMAQMIISMVVFAVAARKGGFTYRRGNSENA